MGLSITRRGLLLQAVAAAVMTSVPLHAATPGGGTAMQLRFSFDTHDFTATLDDTPTARDLMSMLPLDLTIEDYSTNEKIARLPRRLTEDGSGPFRARHRAISAISPPGAISPSSTGAMVFRGVSSGSAG